MAENVLKKHLASINPLTVFIQKRRASALEHAQDKIEDIAENKLKEHGAVEHDLDALQADQADLKRLEDETAANSGYEFLISETEAVRYAKLIARFDNHLLAHLKLLTKKAKEKGWFDDQNRKEVFLTLAKSIKPLVGDINNAISAVREQRKWVNNLLHEARTGRRQTFFESFLGAVKSENAGAISHAMLRRAIKTSYKELKHADRDEHRVDDEFAAFIRYLEDGKIDHRETDKHVKAIADKIKEFTGDLEAGLKADDANIRRLLLILALDEKEVIEAEHIEQWIAEKFFAPQGMIQEFIKENQAGLQHLGDEEKQLFDDLNVTEHMLANDEKLTRQLYGDAKGAAA